MQSSFYGFGKKKLLISKKAILKAGCFFIGGLTLKIARYRALRLACRLTVAELAQDIGISPQRLSQVELRPGRRLEDPERFIKALEKAVTRQMDICRYTLDRCQRMRGQLFEPITAVEAKR